MIRTILKGTALIGFIFFTATATYAQPAGGGGGQGQGGQPPGTTSAPVDDLAPILLIAISSYSYVSLQRSRKHSALS